MGSFLPARLRATAFTVAAVVAGSLFVAVPAASADTAPAAGVPDTVSTDILPTPQIDAPDRKGVVWSQVIVGNTVYVGGNFTDARPSGSAVGVNTTPRSNILAYDIRTGALLPFAPVLNGQVRGLAASPDGSRVYAVGEFTSVNGQYRSRIAAFDTQTGALVTTFKPAASTRVNAVVVTDEAVFVGGWFTSVTVGSTKTARTYAAALNPSTGAVLPFNPLVEGGTVSSLVASPDGAKVVIGGNFTSTNGSNKPGYGMAALDSSTGKSMPWAVNDLIRNGGVNASITSLSSDGDSVYGSAYKYAGDGNLEGSFRANWSDGKLVWLEDCHGDTYSIAPAGDVVYTASHAHYCTNVGSFPEDIDEAAVPAGATATNYAKMQRGMAWTKAAGYTVTTELLGKFNFEGKPAPTNLNWWPDINTGKATGMGQGAWNVVANDDYVLLGGEFSAINNKPQMGLVRYAVKSIAPNKDGPRLSGANYVPTAESVASGSVNITWPANYDRDNEFLTYQLIRDGQTASPIHTETTPSRIWFDRPLMSFLDTGLAPGSTHTYRVKVTDPSGNTVTGSDVSVTASSTASLSAYAKTVLQDSPSSYWRLGDSGTTVADSSTTLDQVATSTVTRGTTGAVTGDSNKASTFTGSDSFSSTQRTVFSRNDVSVEAWFKTTSTAGGTVVDFGNAKTGSSTKYDRDVYVSGSGVVSFGTYSLKDRRVQTTKGGYNDGRWHHVVASVSDAGTELYVDGTLAARRTDSVSVLGIEGYWRIGGDTSRLGGGYFGGAIDEVAVYDQTLTAAEIAEHYTAATGSAPVAPAPEPSARVIASDAFSRTTSGGLGTADLGGAWTTTGTASNYSVSSGAARFSTPAGTTNTGYLGSVSTTDSTVSAVTAFDKAPTGSGYQSMMIARRVGSASYLARVKVSSTGSVVLQLVQGGTTLSQATIPGLTYSAGDQLKIEVSATGTSPTTLNAKVWDAAAAEPAWQITATDSTAALQTAGSAGISGYASSTVTNAPVQIAFDDVAVSTTSSTVTPANVAPTASFTSSTSGLTASVDGSGSSDSDGTIRSYAWTFGDGSTAGTATASRTYAAAGNYTVTLTVTDDDGATKSTSKSVTVTAPTTTPTPTAAFAADTFARTTGSGLGTAETGGTWSVSGSASNYSVASGTGRLVLPTAGTTSTAYLGSVSSTNADVSVVSGFDKAPTGSGYQTMLIGRRVGTANYLSRVKVSSTGAVTLQLVQGGTTLAQSTISNLSYAVGDRLDVRLQVTGTSPTTLRSKVWKAGTTEPASWQLTATDSTAALQAAGSVGVSAYLSGNATNAPVTLTVDDFEARTP